MDEYEGAAWVGLKPSVMADVRYVRHGNGRDGLWFLSIEAACLLMLAARAVGAPYNPGALSVSAGGETVSRAGSR
ncbi:hypothetical protein [Streptomyces sp. NPDC005859]|uniref:hypothetical protein n=1 Tax=Streptomyces sp. NPDC005859 TaxID=3157170 RepID=UPI00340724D8